MIYRLIIHASATSARLASVLGCVLLLAGSGCAGRSGPIPARNQGSRTESGAALVPEDIPIVYSASATHLSPRAEGVLRRIALTHCAEGGRKKLWFIYDHLKDHADVFCRPDVVSGRMRRGETFRIWDFDAPFIVGPRAYLQVSAKGNFWPASLEIPKPSVVWGLPFIRDEYTTDEQAVTVVDLLREHIGQIGSVDESLLDIFDDALSVEFNHDDSAGRVMFFGCTRGHYCFEGVGSWVN